MVMKKFQSSYNLPPAPYQPGQKIRIQGKTYTVISSSHTHTQLQGVCYAVANWALEQMRRDPEEFALFRENTDPQERDRLYDRKAVPATSEHLCNEVRCP